MPIVNGGGDMYVGGIGTNQTGLTNRLVRLRRDGSIAAGFQEPRLLQEGILTITLTEDGTGDAYVGGITITTARTAHSGT